MLRREGAKLISATVSGAGKLTDALRELRVGYWASFPLYDEPSCLDSLALWDSRRHLRTAA